MEAQIDSLDNDLLLFIKELASKMTNPHEVVAVVTDKKNRSPNTQSFPWNPLSLSHGYPALVLLFSTLDKCYPSENWDKISHNYVLKIKEAVELGEICDFSLFGGLAGICLSLNVASRRGTRYQKLSEKLFTFLEDGVANHLLPPLNEEIALGIPSKMQSYDLMGGIVGIGSAFLSAQKWKPLEDILKTLIKRIKKIKVGEHWVYGWYVPSHYQFIESDKQMFPKGNFNLGCAHGIPGILALLSLATLKGLIVEGQLEAIEEISQWLITKKLLIEKEIFWPDRISYEQETGIVQLDSSLTIDAWCYGSAGVGRTLYLAGKALKNPLYQHEAEKAFESIAKRVQKLSTSSFCHGFAGLMVLAYLMGQDTKSSSISGLALNLKDQLLAQASRENPLWFKDSESIHKEFSLNDLGNPSHSVRLDKAGLLDGVAGILLALFTLQHGEEEWLTPFLITQ